MKIKNIWILLVIIHASNIALAQEKVVPLKTNSALFNQEKKQEIVNKTTALSLPFIDDFSDNSIFPNANFWVEKQAYINNTMTAMPITKGIATLDALNEVGQPYAKVPNVIGFADSLTSQPIDLSVYATTSNVFLSFFYQPQGLGFAPEPHDSLFLFYKNNQNNWVQMWKTKGAPSQSFRYVILPITDTQFLHATFQFRFCNIASLDINNDTWNLDYIKVDANRSYADSINNDIACTTMPTSILYPYNSMPYRHFIANQPNEKNTIHSTTIHNLYNNNFSLNTFCTSTELLSSTSINAASLPTTIITNQALLPFNFSTYNITYSPPSTYSKVIIENKYFFNKINTTDRTENDTIVRNLVFDNYFSYDDGSAEKAYFLYPAFNYPSKTALEFTMNVSDTVRGLMVHFAPQIPNALGKKFNIILYKTLAGNGLQDSVILEQNYYNVMYENSVDGFTSYAFETPKFLDAGKYYIGITQPANFGSDSIYYGLDVNNNTNLQKLYYNVNGVWVASATEGSIMMRPIVGEAFTPSAISSVSEKQKNILVYPNPVQEKLFIKSDNKILYATFLTIKGDVISYEQVNNNSISTQDLSSGFYMLQLQDEKQNNYYQKIYKQ